MILEYVSTVSATYAAVIRIITNTCDYCWYNQKRIQTNTVLVPVMNSFIISGSGGHCLCICSNGDWCADCSPPTCFVWLF